MPKIKHHIGEIVVETEGEENLQNCLEVKGGAIVGLTGHIGNWEYTVPFTVHKLGLPMTAIAKPLHNKTMNEFINGIRRDSGGEVLSSREGSKGMMGVLRRKGVMAIVADQDAGRRGEFLRFFDAPASTYVGPALFAWRMGVPLMPTFMIRTKCDKYKMIFCKAIAPPDGENDKDKIICAMMQEYNDRLEETIRKYPEQYFWFHRRWKSKPDEIRTKSNRKVKEISIT